jgi:transposase-like protein
MKCKKCGLEMTLVTNKGQATGYIFKEAWMCQNCGKVIK